MNCEKKKAIIISTFDWYKQRLKPIKKILENSYNVEILLSDFLHGDKCRVTSIENDCTYIHVPSYKKNISLKRLISHLFFGLNVYKFLNEYNPDLIYCLVPPNNVSYLCSKYKKKNKNVKLIFDIIDLWPESMPIDNKFILNYWGKIRNISLCKADYVFMECDYYKEKLKKYLKEGLYSTLYLCKDVSDIDRELINKIINGYSIRKDIIRFCYLGSINNIIDIESITIIVKTFIYNGYKVFFDIIGAGEKKDELIDTLRDVGCIVNYYGKIYDEGEKINILTKSDFAFNMMKESVHVGLTIKSIDYFSYGLPIINNIKGDTWNLISKYNIGINYKGDPQEIFSEVLNDNYVDRKSILKLFDIIFSVDTLKREFADALKLINS